MGRGITCDIVGEPLRYFKRKNPTGMEVARHQAGPRHSASGAATPTRAIEKAPQTNLARNLGTLTFLRHPKNRGISTIQFQNLKYGQGNYVRHCWGTTPVFQTEDPTTHGPSPHTPPQTQRGRDRFPGHGLVTLGGTQHSATRLADQAVMSTWSSTAARPASRRATGTRNGEQDT